MKDLNIVVIVGRLTKDPEIRVTADNTPVVNFTIANNRGKKKDGEELKSSFIKVTAWNELANTVNIYLSKGRKILVQGELVQKSYIRKTDGYEVTYLALEARQVTFLDYPKKEESGEI